MNNWFVQDADSVQFITDINQMPDEAIGFTYKITNRISGKYYIGKKILRNRRTMKPLKGKKRKRLKMVESDWKTYYGSSNKLKIDIADHGEYQFSREILYFCESKSEMSYKELIAQIEADAIHDPNSYNEIINIRLRVRK